MAFDKMSLRRAYGRFVTGVTVVTTLQDDGTPRGFTANSFTSVSLDPPLVLVCLGRGASSFQTFSASRSFCVNILSEQQRKIASTFASKIENKFEQVDWSGGKTGSPVISQVSAWLDCRLERVIDAGDHVVLLGKVVDFATGDSMPLGYYDGAFIDFELQRQAVNAATHDQISVGAILEREGSILMLRDGDKLVLPCAQSIGSDETEPGSLLKLVHDLGAGARLGIVYAVSEERERRMLHVYYRGDLLETGGPLDPRVALVALSDLPWDRIALKQNELMLRRYIQERASARFGIYVGDINRGVIHRAASSQRL